MKRFCAFWTAVVLFLCTVLGVHLYTGIRISADPDAYASWTDEAKSQSYFGMTQNMQENTIPVFGSSEFQHGRGTPFHPTNLFAGTGFSPMLIGAGYYQSLGHAVTLAALESSMHTRKAVLILSPQWFRKTGVVPQAYMSRFSELLYRKMLGCPKLSEETREYICERTHLLLEGDDSTLRRICRAEELASGDCGGPGLQDVLWKSFLEEKDRVSVALKEEAAGIHGKTEGSGKELREPDWQSLEKEAEAQSLKEEQNPFYIEQKSYEKLVPYLKKKRGMNRDAAGGYQKGPEFGDLECFLKVCRDTGITPMLVLVPVNGYYYDFTEFPSSARQAYYEKIRKIAEKYDARIADFSGEEYTRYFFEDRVHLGRKGWVKVCEEIWRFGQEQV